jgi:F-type H+-transporting ATPase subunit a
MVLPGRIVKNTLAALFAVVPFISFANSANDTVAVHGEHAANAAHSEVAAGHGEHAPASKKDVVDAYIQHHLQDSHDFVFFSDEAEGKHYGFSLPVILVDNGLKIFSSSRFHHGEKVAEADGEYYKLVHGKIYKTDAQGTLDLDAHGHPTDKNVKPFDMSITKNVVTMLFVSILMFIMFVGLAKSYKKGPIPTGFGRVLEPLIIFIREEVAIPNIGEKKYRKYMGFLLTVFFLYLDS